MNIHLKPQFPKKKKIRQQMHPPKLRPKPQCPNAPMPPLPSQPLKPTYKSLNTSIIFPKSGVPSPVTGSHPSTASNPSVPQPGLYPSTTSLTNSPACL